MLEERRREPGELDAARWRNRNRRAARYRENQFGAHGRLEDAMEAARNLVEAEQHEPAAALAASIAGWMQRSGHSVALAAFAGEILARVPLDSQAARGLAQLEADANEAIGLTGAAEARWGEVIDVYAALAAAEPDRADYQRDLSVSYERLGDLMRAVGRGVAEHRSSRRYPAARWHALPRPRLKELR